MKKESLIYVFRLLLLGLVLFVSAFQKGAANPLDNRWQPLSYQDGVGIFFHTATIRFTDGNEGQIRFWQRCALDAAAANEFSDLLSGYDEKLQVSYFLEDLLTTFDFFTNFVLNIYQTEPVMNTEEYIPLKIPMINGKANSLIEGTPIK